MTCKVWRWVGEFCWQNFAYSLIFLIQLSVKNNTPPTPQKKKKKQRHIYIANLAWYFLFLFLLLPPKPTFFDWVFDFFHDALLLFFERANTAFPTRLREASILRRHPYLHSGSIFSVSKPFFFFLFTVSFVD